MKAAMKWVWMGANGLCEAAVPEFRYNWTENHELSNQVMLLLV
jgi:hypothetical protein